MRHLATTGTDVTYWVAGALALSLMLAAIAIGMVLCGAASAARVCVNLLKQW